MSDPIYVPGPGDLPVEFGPFRILRKLGKGGMAVVYLALNPDLDRREALKVPGRSDFHFLERFRQEAAAAAQLHHPNLCHVYATGDVGGLPYLTMRYVGGPALGARLADFAAPRQALALVEKLALALAVAHAAGVVHRDLKPSNILFDDKGEPVIVDFGLAVRLTPDDVRLTLIGDVLGTPAYMPPEQHGGSLDQMGPQSDIYSLGIILYELLTGRRPFAGTAPSEIYRLKQANAFDPPTAVRPGLDPRLDDVCRCALAADPAARFATMRAFADALARLLDDSVTGPTEPLTVVPAPAPPTGYSSDPQIAEEVLEIIGQWGWGEALERLDEHIRLTEDARARGLLRLTVGVLRGLLGYYEKAVDSYREAGKLPELEAWCALGQAFVAYRQGDLARASALLEDATTGDMRDRALTATIYHLHGAVHYQRARDADALKCLYRAAEMYGADSPCLGRVLDTLGMVYATGGDFALAHAFYTRSLEEKRKHRDRAGEALTCGQLGRLYLDWGDLDRARDWFRRDLEICQAISDVFGEAKMYNHLGQVELLRGQAKKALDYLDESVKLCLAGRWTNAEGYARKDRALARAALGRIDAAREDARQAEALFEERKFAEGTFHARRAMAQVEAAAGNRTAAERLLRGAAAFFGEKDEHAEAARTWLEFARVQRRFDVAAALVAESLRQALDHAERARRDRLIEAVEAELAEVDAAELYARRYRRARGRGIDEDVHSLTDARQETATILFLDLRNFSGFVRDEDPLVVRRTLNQIWGDLERVLERQDVVVNQHLGDGFMAFARGDGHARRAVAAGLDIQTALTDFNRPRKLLGLDLIEARVGVSTGSVVFANVGTFRKIDFTAVGPATNEAARLQTVAEPGAVCASEATWAEVKDVYRVREPGGRLADLKGLGTVRVWDIVGRL